MNRARRGTGVALAAAWACSFATAQTTERVSVGPGGLQGNESSFRASISADGRFVAFDGPVSNLVAGDTNGTWDVFVHDRQLGTTELVSVTSSGVSANGASGGGVLSADGRYIAFGSAATNLVAGDSNGKDDTFLRDRVLGTTECVSLSSSGAQGNGDTGSHSLSADARFVAFVSSATNLVAGDTNGQADVFVRDRLLGTTERVSVDSNGLQANGVSGYYGSAISADGRYVVFQSYATNLVAGDTNGWGDIFLRDRLNGMTERISVSTSGGEGNEESGYTSNSSISADGRLVAFQSAASNLVLRDTNAGHDIFVRDRQLGTTVRVSLATGIVQGHGWSDNPVISADGHYVAFQSWAPNLVAGDTNGRMDIFLHDLLSGTTERVSLDPVGAQGNGNSTDAALSSDGRFVAFHSLASNLVAGDTNIYFDIFVRDRTAPPPALFCLGDASSGACPCGNSGLAGRGCENSASTGGAVLTATGSASLAHDTLALGSFGEVASAPCVFLLGDSLGSAVFFGDGLLCLAPRARRLYVHTASGGSVGAPQPGDLSISARSAALGDVLAPGARRHYQTYYRDPDPAFCPNPPGDGWNVSSGITIVWTQ